MAKGWIGVVCQMIAEHYNQEMIDQVLSFCVDVGLPVCFHDLQIEPSEGNLHLDSKGISGSSILAGMQQNLWGRRYCADYADGRCIRLFLSF